jgi:hypothetical protein
MFFYISVIMYLSLASQCHVFTRVTWNCTYCMHYILNVSAAFVKRVIGK